MEIFSARLKWLRERKGYTQKEMAELIDMTQSSYSKYEYNLRQPKLETLALLPDILGESIDFMIGVENLDKLGKHLYKDYFGTKEALEFAQEELNNSDSDSVEYEKLKTEFKKEQNYFKERKEIYETYIKSVPFCKYEEPIVSTDTKEIYRRINKDTIRVPKGGWPWMNKKDTP